jgi:hypothetical protein
MSKTGILWCANPEHLASLYASGAKQMSEMRDVLRREIKVLAFDQYGTIVDMQKGLTEAVTPFLKQKGWDGKPNNFVTWWRRTHFENSMIDALCDRGHTPYRQIGHRAVSYVMDRSGIAYTQEEVSWLVGEIEKLKPFPDVVAALKELRSRGYKLQFCQMATGTCSRPRGRTLAFRSIMSFRCRRPGISNRTGRLTRKRKKSLAMIAPAFCLLQIMPSIALAQSLTACGPRSSTAVSDRLAKRHISLISL